MSDTPEPSIDKTENPPFINWKNPVTKALAVLSMLLLLFILYTSAWAYYAHILKKQTLNLFNEAAKVDILFQGSIPVISGYPFRPKIKYTGAIEFEKAGHDLRIQDLEVSSLFLPGHEIRFRSERGVYLASADLPHIWSIDEVDVKIIIPDKLPKDLTRESLMTWQETDPSIVILDLFLKKQELKITGTGNLKLNRFLQPEFLINVRAVGFLEFIEYMRQSGVFEVRKLILTQSIFKPLLQKDEKTGEKFLSFPLKLQNQAFFVGPVKVADVPEIQWPWRLLPRDRQDDFQFEMKNLNTIP